MEGVGGQVEKFYDYSLEQGGVVGVVWPPRCQQDLQPKTRVPPTTIKRGSWEVQSGHFERRFEGRENEGNFRSPFSRVGNAGQVC